jgi:hypothetical protein
LADARFGFGFRKTRHLFCRLVSFQKTHRDSSTFL